MKYKKIIIEEHLLTDDEKFIVQNIENNKLFKGLKFQIEDNNLVLLLNSIDLNQFKITLNNILNQYDMKLSDTIFFDVLLKIESIGSYGIKSGKRLFVDYDKERKVKGRKQKVEGRGIYYYTKDNEFSKNNNKIPKKFENRIICGDSEEVLKKLPDNCIDLVFTSPPYNFGLDYENYKDGVDWNNYFNKLLRILKECIRVVKYGGRIIVNVQPLYSDYIPIHHIISDFFMKNKMIWRNEILWEKNNYNAKYTAWGSWKSPSSPYLKYTWEFLEVFSKGDLKHSGEYKNADITADEFKEWVTAKWSIAPERKMKELGHPAMFPEKLAERTLKLFSFKNDIVLDPFNGVGTATKVANKTGRRYLGIDTSEEYCKKAKKRIKENLIYVNEQYH